ncbi:MAG: Xaa-Pro peptidase family protein [Acidimicrobiales bacterium]|nr:Xaa-Pro peptidase family protein [Acidimicrobiales bacterium]MDG1845351.1 Xaa-Pro peptidase family protein [Acidimicrobiales bacterium]
MFSDRLTKARNAMDENNIDALLLSVGADLPYFTGYEAMPLERLTMLVVPKESQAKLIVPALEAPRVVEHSEIFTLHAWTESQDPIDLVADQLGAARSVAIGDTTWTRFTIELLNQIPDLDLHRANNITSPIRSIKSLEELERLKTAASAVDRIAARLQNGEIDLIGQTESQVSKELGRQIIEEGHHRVNFAIVAAGANAASPHHEPGSRVIQENEVVLCDFGGTWVGEDGVGYCSDITRCVWTGSPPEEFLHLYNVLQRAQSEQVKAAMPGTPAEEIDRVGRNIINEEGFGPYFIHRTGHGIGVEAHEDPYIVEGNAAPVASGNVFSIEPGIYIPGEWGARLEDIVAVTDQGPEALNTIEHDLAVLS